MTRSTWVIGATAWLAACGAAEPTGKHEAPRGSSTPTCPERLAALPDPAGTLLADPEAPFAFPPLQTDVPLYELEVPAWVLEALAADVEADDLYDVTFVHDGRRYPAKLRYRGNSSRDWPKKSWRIEFPDDVGFDGRHKLNLISEWKDCTLMVEKLGYDLLAAMGVPAPTATHVRLNINGQYQGVYLDLERIDQKFTAAHGFPDPDPTIYRCGRKDCELKLWRAEFQKPWEKKTNEGEDDSRLQDFLCAVNAAPEPRLPELLDRTLEVELYLRSLVADVLISNNVVEDSRSYLVLDAVTGRWLYVPWDFNNASLRYQPGSHVGTRARVDHPLLPYSVLDGWSEDAYQRRVADDPDRDWHPLFSNLNTRVAFHPELRERFLRRLEQALATLFAPDVIAARIEANHALIAPFVPGDANVPLEKFEDGPRYLADYVARRTDFLRAEVDRLRGRSPAVVLDRIDPSAGTVVLRNRSTAPVDLAGWTLTTDLRRRPAPNLAGVLGPDATLELRPDALGLALAPVGEVGLWQGPRLEHVADLLFLGELPPGRWLARNPDARWNVGP